MFFKALACDYDGPLAALDLIRPSTLAALRKARSAGLHLILVTGRTFFELIRVCEALDLFEAVVAENGGVIYYPGAALIRDQAPPPPPRLLSALGRRGLAYEVGRVVVGVARGDEQVVREVLAETGVSLELVYNRAALMLLPTGISKGTGTARVVRALGLSLHDTLALGDAEDDLDLFAVCGWAACPSKSMPALQARADWVFPVEHGEGIARALGRVIVPGRLEVADSPRHRVALGWAAGTSEPVTIPERGVNALVQGDALAGKSWLAGAMVERLLDRRYAVCVIDPEGDYRGVGRLPGVTWVAIDDVGGVPGAIRRFERDPEACVVVDLSAMDHPQKGRAVELALEQIRGLRQRLGLPHWVVLDEAQAWLHARGVTEEHLGLEDKGFCLVTYKVSWLRESVMRGMDRFLFARTTDPEQLAFLRTTLLALGPAGAWAVGVLPDLSLGEFVAMQPHPPDRASALTFTATSRDTPHVRHLKKYADTRTGAGHEFVFRRTDGTTIAEAGSLLEFCRVVTGRLDVVVLDHHARCGDFSRWVQDIFSDAHLASQLRKVERRWARGEIDDLGRALACPVALRYGTEGEETLPERDDALTRRAHQAGPTGAPAKA